MKLSQKQKILTVMARQPERWFYPYDFMRNDLGMYFVGYKAGTRLSELGADYPLIFEKKDSGKYVVYRLRIETIGDWLHTLPKDLRYALHRTGVTRSAKVDAEKLLEARGYKIALQDN